jgi:hypothetical protein
LFQPMPGRDRRREWDVVAVRMKSPAAGRAVAIKPRVRSGASDNEAAKLVCAGLALAVITVLLRIVSIW